MTCSVAFTIWTVPVSAVIDIMHGGTKTKVPFKKWTRRPSTLGCFEWMNVCLNAIYMYTNVYMELNKREVSFTQLISVSPSLNSYLNESEASVYCCLSIWILLNFFIQIKRDSNFYPIFVKLFLPIKFTIMLLMNFLLQFMPKFGVAQ